MSIFATGQDIYLKQGDTGNITFSGFPTDKAYTIYLSIYDEDNNNIKKEIEATSFTQETGVALFLIDENTSNSFPVGEWVYGLKMCDSDGTEDTILPKTNIVDGAIVNNPAPKFTVDYKYVEGN